MYKNVGHTIKIVADIGCLIGVVASIICFFILSKDGNVPTAIWQLICGILGSWLGSLVLYGFGQLIENSDIIADRYRTHR